MMDFCFNQYLFYYFLFSGGTFVVNFYTTPTGEYYTDAGGVPYSY